METYRRAAHTIYQLHYHFVFSTKYRKPVLRGDIAIEVRDLVREICRANGSPAAHAQHFLSVHGLVQNLFGAGRHLLRAVTHRMLRTHSLRCLA